MLENSWGNGTRRFLKAFALPALALFFLEGLNSSCAAQDFITLDGQFVKVTPAQKLIPLVPSKPKSVPPVYAPKNYQDIPAAVAMFFKVGAQLVDVERLDDARIAAAEVARVEAERYPGKIVSVSIMADKPIKDINSLDSADNWARYYTVGKPQVYDNEFDAMRRMLGTDYPELMVPGSPSSERSYYAGALLGQAADGQAAEVRLVGPYDVENYKKNEASRQLEIERARSEAAEAAYKQAEKAKIEADKKKDAEIAAKAAQERDRAKKEAEEASSREKHALEVQIQLDKIYKARDEKCSDGSSAGCTRANEEIIELYDANERYNVTVKCMQVEPDQHIQGGVCGPNAPPCMNCSVAGDFHRQDVSDRRIGNYLLIASKFKNNPALDANFAEKISKKFSDGDSMSNILKAIDNKK